MRAGAVQPATWAVLTCDNGGLSVVLNPLVACWEQAAVRPPLKTDTLTRWIIEFYTQESHPLPWPGLLLHVALTGTLPGSTSHLGKESELGPVVVLEERGKWCYDVKETPVFSWPVHHFGPN